MANTQQEKHYARLNREAERANAAQKRADREHKARERAESDRWAQQVHAEGGLNGNPDPFPNG